MRLISQIPLVFPFWSANMILHSGKQTKRKTKNSVYIPDEK